MASYPTGSPISSVKLPWKTRTLLAVVPLGRVLVSLLSRTMGWREVNLGPVEALWQRGGPVIYALWHGRILMVPGFYAGRRPITVLASLHRDGEYIVRFVRGYGYGVVRGSTTRGGQRAMHELLRRIEAGEDIGIIPDGPRGPRYVVQRGIVTLAKLSGAPIVPMTFSASRRRHLRSWDQFLIPHPFARAVVIFGEPLSVPAAASKEEMEAIRRELEGSLRRITEEADRFFTTGAGR